MATVFKLKSVRGLKLVAALGIFMIATAGGGSGARASDPWPAEVQAVYKIHFNSFEIGQFSFNSSVHERTYAITANADISALLGVVRWNGLTRVSGALAGNAPRPTGFSFDYQGSSKAGSVRMGFANGGVKMLDHNPPLIQPPDTVPLQPVHLRGVLDPLSAVLALSRPRDGNPCNQRVSVFDGKVRFDLVFSFKEKAPIADAQRGSAVEMLSVCRVRVLPIAGHRDDEASTQLKRTLGIEVAFRAIPSAKLFVPHRITVPTFAGSAVLLAHSVHIRTQHEQIALVN
jgi:Protein of unknown function (DUF3108)